MAQRKTARKSSTHRRSNAKTPTRSAKTATRSRTAGKASASKKARQSKSGRPGKSDSGPVAAGDREVTIDRRRGDAKLPEDLAAPIATAPAAAPKLERRKKVNRRRQIDPTTCERDYTDDEVEFMNAIDDYKRNSGRMFPTCSEVLEVLRGLGYQKLALGQLTVVETSAEPVAVADEASDWTLESEADMPL